MFSREELFEFFSDRYSPDQITQALQQLNIDPKAQEFPATITEQLEQVFTIVENAVTVSKQLNGSSDLAQVEKLAIEIATQQASGIPTEVFSAMVEIVAGQAMSQAAVLSQVKTAVFKQTLADLDVRSLTELGQDSAAKVQAMIHLLNDPEKLNQILDDYGIRPSNEVVEEMELLNSDTEDFNADKFLQEVAGGESDFFTQEKQPTLFDTKAMVKSLISRSKVR